MSLFWEAEQESARRPANVYTDRWRVAHAFVQDAGLVRHHIESFNLFVDETIPAIVRANHVVTCRTNPNFMLVFDRVSVKTPTARDGDAFGERVQTPHECRLRDTTYAAPVTAKVRYKFGRDDAWKKASVDIARLPIMVRSSRCVLSGASPAAVALSQECTQDPGGYFVVKGIERVILMSEQMVMNRVLVSKNADGTVEATVTSSHLERKSRCSVVLRGRRIYLVHNTFAKAMIPIMVVFKAMGYESDTEVIQFVGTDQLLVDYLAMSVQECCELGITSQKQALAYLASKFGPRHYLARRSMLDEALDCLSSVILCHIPALVDPGPQAPPGPPAGSGPAPGRRKYNWRQKAIYLAMMIRRVVLVDAGIAVQDDRDFTGNKKLETAGDLLALLFDDLFRTLLVQISKKAEQLSRRAQRLGTQLEISSLIDSGLITKGFAQSLSTGNWKLDRFRVDRIGVTQPVSRLSYLSAIGHLHRLASSFEKTRKTAGPRQLNFSQYGVFCPADTPEGEGVGLVKNISLTAEITVGRLGDTAVLRDLLFSLGVQDAYSEYGDVFLQSYAVILNGEVLGAVPRSHAARLVAALRALRRSGHIHYLTSVTMLEEHRAIYVCSDSGRACRPLLLVRDGRVLLTDRDLQQVVDGVRSFADLVEAGKVEFLDCLEAKNSYIAFSPFEVTPQHTHCEIAGYLLTGIVVGTVPYPHHNQSPRNCYQCSMGKQAMSCISYNEMERFETVIYTVFYPQRPLTVSKNLSLTGADNLPGGCNATVCVMSYSGFDIEDALIINSSSIDRGYGRCHLYQSEQTEIQHYENSRVGWGSDARSNAKAATEGLSDKLMGPPQEEEASPARQATARRYASLDLDGIASPGCPCRNNDVLVNRFCPASAQGPRDPGAEVQYVPGPLTAKLPPEVDTYVDKCLLTSGPTGNLLVKVLLRQPRRPEVGDKFSSRHGQKGVVGLVVPQRDMPFSAQGIVPDMIMNPHGYPSRMTVGKLLEVIANKGGALHGRRVDSTCFVTKEWDEVAARGAAPGITEPYVKVLCNLLHDRGFNYLGKDLFYSGITGEPIPAYVYNGPIFYQKLKHMVRDKMHSRGTGPRTMLTRQPTEGRSRSGGLRLGEMEKDVFVAFGASGVLIERMMVGSDECVVEVCACGRLAWESGAAGSVGFWCQGCKTGARVSKVRMPYAAKLMLQELVSMGVDVRLGLSR